LAERKAAQKAKEEEQFTRIKELSDAEAVELQQKLDKEKELEGMDEQTQVVLYHFKVSLDINYI
jgi:hypothetical protein